MHGNLQCDSYIAYIVCLRMYRQNCLFEKKIRIVFLLLRPEDLTGHRNVPGNFQHLVNSPLFGLPPLRGKAEIGKDCKKHNTEDAQESQRTSGHMRIASLSFA